MATTTATPPTDRQLRELAREINNLNMKTKSKTAGDLIVALFARVTALEARVAVLETP